MSKPAEQNSVTQRSPDAVSGSGERQHTVAEILDRFQKESLHLRESPRTQSDYVSHIRRLRAEFGTRVAKTLTAPDFDAFKNVEKGRVARVRALNVLQVAFDDAVKKWGWLDYNVLKEVVKGKSVARTRYVTDEEVEGIKRIVSHALKVAIDLAVLTGRRQRDILALRWSDISDKTISTWEVKPRTPVQISIVPALRVVLDRERETATSEFVVHNRTGQAYTGTGFRATWQKKMKKWKGSGGVHFTFDDLRAKWKTDRTPHAVPPEIQVLIDRPQERLKVELKSWVQLNDPVTRAKIARAIAALANSGGGYLIFGFKKDGSPADNHPGDLKNFNHDQIAGIIDRYLVPTFQCDVIVARPTASNEDCVAVRVPSHGATPICARTNGPHGADDRPVGINKGCYYVRAPGPQSVAIDSPEQWHPLIRRCVIAERDSLLDGIEKLLKPVETQNADEDED